MPNISEVFEETKRFARTLVGREAEDAVAYAGANGYVCQVEVNEDTGERIFLSGEQRSDRICICISGGRVKQAHAG